MSETYVHIVAVGPNNGIGINGDLLISSKEDLKWFRDCTLGMRCLSGYMNTKSLPKLLPGRKIFTLYDPAREVEDSVRNKTNYLIKDLSLIKSKGLVFIIGGGRLYKQTSSLTDALILTRYTVKNEDERDWLADNADTFYEVPDHLSLKQTVKTIDLEDLTLEVIVYAKNHPTLEVVLNHLKQRNLIGE